MPTLHDGDSGLRFDFRPSKPELREVAQAMGTGRITACLRCFRDATSRRGCPSVISVRYISPGGVLKSGVVCAVRWGGFRRRLRGQ